MINHHLNVAEEELKQHEKQKAGRNQRQYQVLFQSKHVDMINHNGHVVMHHKRRGNRSTNSFCVSNTIEIH